MPSDIRLTVLIYFAEIWRQNHRRCPERHANHRRGRCLPLHRHLRRRNGMGTEGPNAVFGHTDSGHGGRFVGHFHTEQFDETSSGLHELEL